MCIIPTPNSEYTQGLEPYLHDTYRLLEMEKMLEQESGKRSSFKRNVKRLMAWNERLFRRTKKGLRLIPGMGRRVDILRSFHGKIGHWDVASTTQFVLTKY